MSKANIKKKRKVIRVPQSLTSEERELLRKVTTGYRTKEPLAEKLEVHRGTLYNAIVGRGLTPDILKKIRTFLKSQSITNEPTKDIEIPA